MKSKDTVKGMREEPRYLTEQIITYLGNKRKLLSIIGEGVERVKRALHKEKLQILDMFSGSGIVSRYFKQHAEHLYVNDIEAYSRCVNSCYLANSSEVDLSSLEQMVFDFNARVSATLHGGFIRELYAPADEESIQRGERVFFSIRNAKYIDTARQAIEELPVEVRRFFLGPLLYGASVHNNTAGVFKGFYKNRDGIGQYGGTARNSLTRIMGDIEITVPPLSRFDVPYEIFQKDAMELVSGWKGSLDLAYLDPPYNMHPYGSNYFMLNLIADYQRPKEISNVSGIPVNWTRSIYNDKAKAKGELCNLIAQVPARWVMISYNSEGFIGYDEMLEYLASLGEVSALETDYETFRGCRNLRNRDIHVKEYLFLLEKR